MSDRFTRRSLLSIAGALAAAASFAQPAKGPIKLVIPFPPGASPDASGRLFADKLSAELGQPVIVDNRPGASGTMGAAVVAKAPPDGQTVLLTISLLVTGPLLMAKPPYDVRKDFKAVAFMGEGSSPLVVSPAVPAKNLREFIAYVKSKGGRIPYGSWGIGSSGHLLGLLLAQQTGLTLTHVPYKGVSPLITDLLGDHINVGFVDLASAIAQEPKGLKILAMGGPVRNPAAPAVQTFSELGYESMDRSGWMGFFMPAGTPDTAVNRFHAAVTRVAQRPEMEAELNRLGYMTTKRSMPDFERLVHSDITFYPKVYQEFGIKGE
jgi:tripartite-type tricarboxylate transporter receptor subunit TctC